MYDLGIPPIKLGDVITADWLNKVARAIRPRVEPGGYQSDAFNVARKQKKRVKRKPGKNSVTPVGRLAKVVDADVAADDLGWAVWLNEDFQITDAYGDPIDPNDQAAIDTAKFEFRNAQAHTGILNGARITLAGNKPVTAGSLNEDTGVSGWAIDIQDQLAALSGTGALVGGNGDTNTHWDKTECPTP